MLSTARKCFPSLRCSCFGNSSEDFRATKNENVFVSEEAFSDLPEIEKNRILTELYGTDDGMEETDDFIEEKLKQLDDSINKIKACKKQSYLRALQQEREQSVSYATSRRLRLMFLRSQLFDVNLSAKRICLFFDEKEELFGVDKLLHRITYDDLDDDDKEALNCGGVYVNSGVDHAGRLVVVFAHYRIKFKTIRNLLRSWFYYAMAWIEDNEVTQKRGFVMLFYNVGNFEQWSPQLKENHVNIRKLGFDALPVRSACIHHCHNNYYGETFLSYVLRFSTTVMQASYRQHHGTHRKVRSQLLQYGLKVHLLPIDPKGNYDYSLLRDTIRKLQRKEERICNLLGIARESHSGRSLCTSDTDSSCSLGS